MSASSLCVDATYDVAAWLPSPISPFLHLAYRSTLFHARSYRRWKLSPDISVVARTTLHAVSRKSGQPGKYVNVFALNEWDPKSSGA